MGATVGERVDRPDGRHVRRWSDLGWRRVDGVVAAVFVALAAIHSTTGRWGGDFPLHVANIRALADDLGGGTHPILGTTNPSVYFTPYTWVLALIAHVSTLDPATVLAAVAPFIAIAFALTLRAFARQVTGDPDSGRWALLFVLVLWGSNPWIWSGYVNLRSVLHVLPYPSMFGMVSGLATLTLLLWLVSAPARVRWWHYVLLGSGLWLTVLSHQISGMWTAIGCVAIAVDSVRDRRMVARLGVTALVAGVLVLVWPLFPFTQLLTDTSRLDPDHKVLYDHLLSRCWPLLLALPVLAWRLKRNRTDPLVLMGAGALAVYAYGWFSGRYTLGRIFPFVGIVAHVAIAQGAAIAERTLRAKATGRRERDTRLAAAALVALAFCCVIGLWNVKGGLRVAQPEVLGGRDAAIDFPSYHGIADHVPKGSVALVDGPAGGVLPSYGIHLMASWYIEPLPTDQATRRRDQAAVLSPMTTESDREALLDRYRVESVVLDLGQAGRGQVRDSLEHAGWGAVGVDGNLVVLRRT